jgi:hypothetical protein
LVEVKPVLKYQGGIACEKPFLDLILFSEKNLIDNWFVAEKGRKSSDGPGSNLM